jgi:hypothetical protein
MLPFSVTALAAAIFTVNDDRLLTLEGMNNPAFAFVFGPNTSTEPIVVAKFVAVPNIGPPFNVSIVEPTL